MTAGAAHDRPDPRFDEAISEIRRALNLDPLMSMFAAMSVGIHRHAGRLDAAIAEFHKAVELDPHSGLAYFHVGSAYFAKGMLDEARASFERSLELTVFSPVMAVVLRARAVARSGATSRIRRRVPLGAGAGARLLSLKMLRSMLCLTVPGIQSPALCWALFDVYIGEKPVSADGKKRVIAGFPKLLAWGVR